MLATRDFNIVFSADAAWATLRAHAMSLPHVHLRLMGGGEAICWIAEPYEHPGFDESSWAMYLRDEFVSGDKASLLVVERGRTVIPAFQICAATWRPGSDGG